MWMKTINIVESYQTVTIAINSISAIQDGSLFLFFTNSTIPYAFFFFFFCCCLTFYYINLLFIVGSHNTPYQLVEIDVVSGTILHAVDACTFTVCPLSFVSPLFDDTINPMFVLR